MSSTEGTGNSHESLANLEGRKVTVLPVDGSEFSSGAFNWYVKNAYMGPQHFLLLVHVVSPGYPQLEVGDTVEVDKLEITAKTKKSVEADLTEGKRLCVSYEERAKKLGIECVALLAVDTSPAQAIIKVAEKHHAGLIVIGSRGKGVLRRTFLGSVSAYIVHHAHIPVAVIPPADEHHRTSTSSAS